MFSPWWFPQLVPERCEIVEDIKKEYFKMLMLLNLKQWALNAAFKKQITDYFIGSQFSIRTTVVGRSRDRVTAAL